MLKICCKKMQEHIEINCGSGRIKDINKKFNLYDSDGYNPIDIEYCPFCGHKLESWEEKV